MIVEILEEKKNFTNSEVQIADYILKNPFNIINLTAIELGEKTYTSKSSVFRLCKKLGVNSYDEFKLQIELEMNEKSRLNTLLSQEPFNKNSSLKDIINILPSFYDTAISNTKLSFNYDDIKRIVKQLNNADKIDIYCSGITSSCATAAMFKFFSIGKECAVYSAINEHYLMSVKDKKIISILLSFTGENSGMIHIAKYLKRLGMYTIGIGSNEKVALKNQCNEYIGVYQKNLVMSLEMLTPYISMTYIFDVLFASLLVKDFDHNLHNSIDVMKMKSNIIK